MAHGLVLRLEEYARATMGTNQEVEERNMNQWNSTDKLIMYWRKSASHSVDTKMEFIILLRETLLHVFSPDWLHSPNRNLLVQAVKENNKRFPEIVKGRPQLHEVLERIFPDPWYNSFFPWNELFQGKLTVEDKCVQEFFHSEPEDIIIGRIHSFAKSGSYHEALTLAKQSFLYYYRVTRNAVFYSKPPSRDRNRYMHEKSRLGHASIDWIVLLWRKQRTLQFISKEILQFTCHEGVEIIGRMRENPKLKKFSLECLQILLVRDNSVPSQLCCTKKFYLLFCTMHKELNSSPKDFAANATNIVARLVPSSAHLYLFVEAAYEIYGARYIDLYVDFYVRGLTADFNHLEIKKQEELHDEVESLEKHIVAVFEKLATLFLANNHLEAVRECLFSAYSLRPTKELLHELLRLTQSLDSNSQKQLNFTSSNSSLFPVKNCSHGLKCDGSCSTANTMELTHPLLSKGIRNISYIVIQDLTTVLECKRHIRFHYNYYDWHLNVAELTEHLKESDVLTTHAKELASDAGNTDLQRTNLSASAEKESSSNTEGVKISPSVKRKSSEIPIDVGANVEVGTQVPSKRIKVFTMSPNSLPQPVTSTPSIMPKQNNIQNAIDELIRQTLIGDKIPKGHSKVYSVSQDRSQSPFDSNVQSTSSDNRAAISPYRSYEHEQHLSFASRTPCSTQSTIRYSSPTHARQSVVVAPTSKALVRTEHIKKKSRPNEVVMKSAINEDSYNKTKIWKSSPKKEENALKLSSGRNNAEKHKHFQNYLLKASRFAPTDPLDSASNDSSNTPPPSRMPNHNWVQQSLPQSDRNSVIHHTTQHMNNSTSTVFHQPSASTVGSQYSSSEHYQQKASVYNAMQYNWCNSQNGSMLSNSQGSFSKDSKYGSPPCNNLKQFHVPSSQSYVSHSSPQHNKHHRYTVPELPHSVASTSLSGYSNLSQKERKPSSNSLDVSKQLETVKINTVQLPRAVSSIAEQMNLDWRKLKGSRDVISNYQATKSSNSHLYSSVTTSSTQIERQPSRTVSVKSQTPRTVGKMMQSSVTEKSSDISFSNQAWFSSFPKDSSSIFAESFRTSSQSNSSSYLQSPVLTAHEGKARTATSSSQNPKVDSLVSFKVGSSFPTKTSSSPLLCDRLSQESPTMQQRHSYPALDQVISRDSHGVVVFRAQNVVPASQHLGSTPQTQACCSPLETKPCESCSSVKKSDPGKDSSQALNLSQQAFQEDLINYSAKNQGSKILSSIFEPKVSSYDPIVSCPFCLLELPESLIITHMENSHREKLKLQEYDFTKTKVSINSTQSVYSSSLHTPRISVVQHDVKSSAHASNVQNWLKTDLLTNVTSKENDSALIQYFGSGENLFSTPEMMKQESAIQFSNHAGGVHTMENVRKDSPHLEAESKSTASKMDHENENIPRSAHASSSFSGEVSVPSSENKLPSSAREKISISCSFCKEPFEDSYLFKEHWKVCGLGYRDGPYKTSESSNSAQMSRFCDTPQDSAEEQSKMKSNQINSPPAVSELESSDSGKPKKEKKANQVHCPYCNKLLTVPYMKTHFLKKHKDLPPVKYKKSVSISKNNLSNSTVIKQEESSNAALSPTLSNKYDTEDLDRSHLVSTNQSKVEFPFANFDPLSEDKFKCIVCFRTLTNESFLKKHLKNIHGVDPLLPDNCKDDYTSACDASEIKHEKTSKSLFCDSSLSVNYQATVKDSHANTPQKELVPVDSINNPNDSSEHTLSHDGVKTDSNLLLSNPNNGFEHQLSSGDDPKNGSVKTEVKRKVKAFRCHLCPKAFAYKSNLDKHIESVHKSDLSSINNKGENLDSSVSTKNVIDYNEKSILDPKELLSPNLDAKDTYSENKKSGLCPLSSSTSFGGQINENLNYSFKTDSQAQKFGNKMPEEDSQTEHFSEKMDKVSCTICHQTYGKRELFQHILERHSGSFSANSSSADSCLTTKTLTVAISETNQPNLYGNFNVNNQANAKSFEIETDSGRAVPGEKDLLTSDKVMPSQSKCYDFLQPASQTSKNECGAVVPYNQDEVTVNNGKKNISKKKRTSAEAHHQIFKDKYSAGVPFDPKERKQANLYFKSTCDICYRTLSSPGNLMRHKKNVHSFKNIKSERKESLPESCISTSGLPSTEMIYDVETLQNKNLTENTYTYSNLERSTFISDPISFPADDQKTTDCDPPVDIFPPIRDNNNDDFDLMLSELFGAREENDETLGNLALTYNPPEENRSLVHLERNYTAQKESMSMIPFEGHFAVQEENRSILPLEGNYTALEESNRSLLSLEGQYTSQEENNRSILPLERNYTAQEENSNSLHLLKGSYAVQEEKISILPLEASYTPQEENNRSILPLDGSYTIQEESNRSILPLDGSYTIQEENNRSILPLDGSYTIQEENNTSILPLVGNYTTQEETNRSILPLEGNYSAQEDNQSILPLEASYTAQEENNRSLLPLEGSYSALEESNRSLLPLEGSYPALEESNRSILPLDGNYTSQEMHKRSIFPLEGNFSVREENDKTVVPFESNYTSQEENNKAVLPYEGNYNAQEESTKTIFSLENNYDFKNHMQEDYNDTNKGYDNLSNERGEPQGWQSFSSVSDSSLRNPIHSLTSQPYEVGSINYVVKQSMESIENQDKSLVNENARTNPSEPKTEDSFVLPPQEHLPASTLVPTSTVAKENIKKKRSMLTEQISRLCQPDNTCQICQHKKYSCRSALRLHIKSKHMNIKVVRKDRTTKVGAQSPCSVAIQSESVETFESNQPQGEAISALTSKHENVPMNALVPIDTTHEKVENTLSNIAEQIAPFCLADNFCQVCQKSYSSKSALHIHVKKIHLNIRENTPKNKSQELNSDSVVKTNKSEDSSVIKEDKVKCPLCCKRLAKRSVQRHIKKCHEKEMTKKDLAEVNLPSALQTYDQEIPTSTLKCNSQSLSPKKEQHSMSISPVKEHLKQVLTDNQSIKDKKIQKDTFTDPSTESGTSKLVNSNIASSSEVADSNQETNNALKHLIGNECQLNGENSEISNAKKKGSSALLQLAETFLGIDFPRNSSSPTKLSDAQVSKADSKSSNLTDHSKLSSNEGTSLSSLPSRTESSTLHPVEAFEKNDLESSHGIQNHSVLSYSPIKQKSSCEIESVETRCDGAPSGSNFTQEVTNHTSKSLLSNESGSTLEEKQIDHDVDHKFVLSVLKDLEDSNKETASLENLENHEGACKKVEGNNSEVSSAPLYESSEKVTKENLSELSLDASSEHKSLGDTSTDLSFSNNAETEEHTEISDTAPCSDLLEVQSRLKDKDGLPVERETQDIPIEEHVKDTDEKCNASDLVLEKSNQSGKCRLCPKKFKSMSALSRHLKSTHSVPLLKKAITSSSSFSENENKLSPPNLSLALTQEVNSSKVSSPTDFIGEDSSISGNFGCEERESSFIAMKTSLENNGVTVKAVPETKDSKSSSRVPLKSKKRLYSTKQSISSIKSPQSVFLVDLTETAEVSDTVNVSASIKDDDSHDVKLNNLPPLIKKKQFANTSPFKQVNDSNESKQCTNSLPLKQELISEDADAIDQEKTVDESQHSLPKCIIKVCKGKKNSVSYEITKKGQDLMPIARKYRKQVLRKRVIEESCDSDDSVIIISDTVLSDYESPRRNKRRRIPRKPYRDADYEKGALKFSSRFSRLPKKPELVKKPNSKPKKRSQVSVATKASCVQTYKGLIDIQQFLKEHKQPCVRLPRIEDLISNFDWNVLSYTLSNYKLSKQIKVSKKVHLCKTQSTLVRRKSSGHEILVTDSSVNSKFKFKDNIRKPVNSKNKNSNQSSKKNPDRCSCGMCQFCISSSPIKECYVMLQKLPSIIC